MTKQAKGGMMFIEKITICNLFAYYGAVEVEFPHIEGKNLYCIYGQNGFGKTSFINACKIAICGSGLRDFNAENGLCKKFKLNAQSFIKGNKKGFSGILNTYAVNESKTDFYIAITGKLNDNRSFYLKRGFENIDWELEETLALSIDEEHFSDEEAQEKINALILPSNFVDFFFFNGEEIGEISENLHTGLKEKIEEILRIKPLDIILKQIDKITNELNSQALEDEKQKQSFEERLNDIEKAKNSLDSIQRQINIIQEQQESKQYALKEKEKEIQKLISSNDKTRQELYDEKHELEKAIQAHKEGLEEAFKHIIFLSNPKLTKQLNDEIQAIESHKQSQDIQTYQKLLPGLKATSNKIIQAKAPSQSQEILKLTYDIFDTFLQNLEQQSSYNSQISPSLIESLKLSLVRIENNALKSYITKSKELKNQLAQCKREIDEFHLDSYTQTQKAYLEQEISKLKQAYQEKEQEENDLQEERQNLQSKINHLQVELEAMRQHIHNERIEEKIKILKALQNTLQAYKQKLISTLKGELRENILQKYKMLISDNVNSIKIDEDFKIHLYNSNEDNIYIQSQSSGQKQILAIAIFWALSELSHAEIPLIIDTPLGRIDAKNRKNIIQNYYAQNLQTIIMPTDTEMGRREYEYAKSHIARLYKIENQDDRAHAAIKARGIEDILL